MLDVTVVLLEEGFSSTAVMPVEIFHFAGKLWNDLHDHPAEPAFRVRTVSLSGDTVHSVYGLGMTPHGGLADVERTDIAIVSTSKLDLDLAFVENSALLPWLRHQHDKGALVVGVCMGAAYLAEAGLLDGRMATTHWALSDKFAARYPQVDWRPDLFVTEDSRVLCSGGVFASIDVSLYLVEKLCGHEVAVQCAKSMLLPMPRIHQTGYAMQTVSQAHGDERIRDVEAFLQANFHTDISTQALAERAGLGERTFVRHFKAATGKLPAGYIQALRIQAAKAMLEHDAKPVQAISSDVGYDDVAFFRHLFKRIVKMTPTEYRAHFAPLSVRAEAALEASQLN
ncbi:GlxA family transcriptional regulator [Phenylobacterium sp.]|jgi:transcriptional regulator GlxA family with amidase domain|uniref:GlxA family transcriptional regulator n=1 Tax=Phenylobacterium sp. TaxID=1871053 RepID=UPI002E3231BF|nr:helix-turn-helix domain-containing protein [Phenylobacterium sp.]HEX3366902.1 helix-turn-helix domain-containing protein [Phenylobacterium sp.]